MEILGVGRRDRSFAAAKQALSTAGPLWENPLSSLTGNPKLPML
jgi:hypothetical protein